MFAGVWLIMVGGLALMLGLRGPARPVSAPAWLLIAATLLFAPITALWGLWGMFSAVLNISWLDHFPVFWVTWLASSAIQVPLGATMGLSAVFSIAERTKDDRARTLSRLAVWLSVAALLVGAWLVVSGLLFVGRGQGSGD